MNREYVMSLLNRAIAERNDARGSGGAARVAAELNTSDSMISQLRAGTYPSPQKWHRLIVERYGNETVHCPSLGEIALNRCASERNLPDGAPSAAYARQRRICKACERSKP